MAIYLCIGILYLATALLVDAMDGCRLHFSWTGWIQVLAFGVIAWPWALWVELQNEGAN